VVAQLGETVLTAWDPDLAYGGRLGEGELGIWDYAPFANGVRYYDNVQVSTAPDIYPYAPPSSADPKGDETTHLFFGTPSAATLLTPFGSVSTARVSDRHKSPDKRPRDGRHGPDHGRRADASKHPRFWCTPDGPGNVRCHTKG